MIHYSTSYKPIKQGDELCIYYGHKLWFDDVDDTQTSGGGTDGNTDGNDSGSKNDGDSVESDEETEENGMVAFMNQMQL